MKTFNVILVGGSGFWSEVNHIPNLLALKMERRALKVVGICDLRDPYSMPREERRNLYQLLKKDSPIWIEATPKDSINTSALNKLHNAKAIDLMIIACNPTMHFDYAIWALQNGVSVVCDKPLIDVKNSSSDVNAAKNIFSQYQELLRLYSEAKSKKPYLSFSLMLRRRALPAFNVIADRLKEVAQQYGAGINHLNILNHGGIYKYPQEMQGFGAHDFSAGVGSLSHSSYHYIDLFNRYLLCAPGEIAYIRPKLTNVFRVKDYLLVRSYEKIHHVNAHRPIKEDISIPEEVLACELDFGFQITFLDANERTVGDGNFIGNHVSFAPRTRDYVAGVTEPAQYPDGGRTSHLYIDIHQSGLQNIELVKNDVAFNEPNILLHARSHPAITSLKESETFRFKDAYNQTEFHLKDMLAVIIDNIAQENVEKNNLVVDIADDAHNVRLFAKFYELIAKNYSMSTANNEDSSDLIEVV